MSSADPAQFGGDCEGQNPSLDRVSPEEASLVGASPERASLVGASPERASLVGAGSDGAGPGSAGSDGAGPGSAGSDGADLEGASPEAAGPDGPGLDRAANVLGALSLVIADQAADAVAEAAGRSESGAAALSALLHFLDRPSIDLLRQVLGLTSSGTVRLIDRLEESGYVGREPGADGRSTSVVLTPAGEVAAERVAAARTEVLQRALAVLSDTERVVLDDLAGKMLVGMMRGPGATRWICRLCDIGVCRGAPGGCPVGNAAIKRYGH
jgi:DNA-binding MarR family transcriptional regulator